MELCLGRILQGRVEGCNKNKCYCNL